MLKNFRKFFITLFLMIAIGLILLIALFLITNKPTEIDTSSPVGFTEISFLDSDRSRQLELYAWYPTDETEEVALFEDNAVFRGFSAIQDASISEATYPLVIFSHGSGGNRGNQSWLATELAKQGAIVVAMNHPGSTSRDSAPATNILTWNRPQDISFVIDSLLEDSQSQLASSIDPERIAIVGHSLGGYTALAIGGAELSLDSFIDYCNEFPNNQDCIFYNKGGVDLSQVDKAKFEQPNRDERVKAVVSIDPAYARSFKAESINSLTKTLLIAPTAEIGTNNDLQVSHLLEQLTDEHTYTELAGAQHFTFLPECKATGFYILMVLERGGQVICKKEDGKARAEFHSETSDHIINFLQKNGILENL